MASESGPSSSRPALVENVKSKSAVWKYFGYEPDEHGKPKDMDKPICRKCYKVVATKSSSTTNLAKHLKDNHSEIYAEFRESQAQAEVERAGPAARPKWPQTPAQPTLPALFEQQRKYAAKSPEALKLDRTVAEFICMDQVPVYIVEKPGFQQMLHLLNPRYVLPSRNHFMYTEIPQLYTTIKQTILSQLGAKPYFACTTDLWTSRSASSFMAVTLQFITESWEMQSWCLGCAGLQSEHTAEGLREALEEMIEETWNLDVKCMAAITTDNASNNKKAFQKDFTWIPCFGHNLHLAISRGLEIERISAALSRLRKTVSAFSRSPKMVRQLKKKQKELGIAEHKLIHDEPTRWDSAFEMTERFLEQQQAVCAVLADDRKKWHLMPKDADITILEIVKEVLSPISAFSDALSGEKHTTLSSILPLIWKLNDILTVDASKDSRLKMDFTEAIAGSLRDRYKEGNLQLLLNTASFLDPRFKDSFVTLRDDVKHHLIDGVSGIQTSPPHTSPPQTSRPTKKTRSDLTSLLTNIQGERKQQHPDAAEELTGDNPENKIRKELSVYETMPELTAEQDPLIWWRTNQSSLPQLARFAKKYLCIAASSCPSERVFSTSGLICSPRRARLTEEHVDMLVFLAKNLKLAKEIQCNVSAKH